MAKILISKETREKLLQSVRANLRLELWLYQFVVADKSLYEYLSENACEVGNRVFFEDLDELLNRARLQSLPPRIVRPTEFPLQETRLPRRGSKRWKKNRDDNNRRRFKKPEQPFKRKVIPVKKSLKYPSLDAYVAEMVAKGHECATPNCKKIVPWLESYCPLCISKRGAMLPSLASFEGSRRCQGCGQATAMLNEDLCFHCLGKGR